MKHFIPLLSWKLNLVFHYLQYQKWYFYYSQYLTFFGQKIILAWGVLSTNYRTWWCPHSSTFGITGKKNNDISSISCGERLHGLTWGGGGGVNASHGNAWHSLSSVLQIGQLWNSYVTSLDLNGYILTKTEYPLFELVHIASHVVLGFGDVNLCWGEWCIDFFIVSIMKILPIDLDQ